MLILLPRNKVLLLNRPSLGGEGLEKTSRVCEFIEEGLLSSELKDL
jgi:hypothetical protein